jgi:hypothetical protein
MDFNVANSAAILFIFSSRMFEAGDAVPRSVSVFTRLERSLTFALYSLFSPLSLSDAVSVTIAF